MAVVEAAASRGIGSIDFLRLWAGMVRTLDIEMIVPQHGARFVGKAMCNRFIDWVENLQCGVDLMDERNYRAP